MGFAILSLICFAAHSVSLNLTQGAVIVPLKKIIGSI